VLPIAQSPELGCTSRQSGQWVCFCNDNEEGCNRDLTADQGQRCPEKLAAIEKDPGSKTANGGEDGDGTSSGDGDGSGGKVEESKDSNGAVSTKFWPGLILASALALFVF
jgi:hypothetical protein